MYIHTIERKKIIAITIIIFITNAGFFYKAGSVIQIDISSILNARPVTTINNGKLTSWKKGVDNGDGYLTMAAATFKNEQEPHALPDNPLIAGNTNHPAILLHYSNNESVKFQARCIEDTSGVDIKVTKNRYSDLYLSFTSAYGSSSIQFEMIYTDGKEIKEFTVPDWYDDIPENNPNLSYVVHNLAKWGSNNEQAEKDHHNIDALNIHPNPARILTAIKIKKGTAGYLILWAATGVLSN